ncbi:alanine:cation symporter family protein, partial [Vibrio alfacsensis]
ILDASHISFGISREISASVLTLLVAFVTLGGIKSIANVAGKVVPTMAVFYVLACSSVIIMNAEQLGAAIQLVVVSAFTSTAATGGFVGAS